MGAGRNLRLTPTVDREALRHEADAVPIDLDVREDDWVHVHYAYWSPAHEIACEQWVEEIIQRYGLTEYTDWAY